MGAFRFSDQDWEEIAAALKQAEPVGYNKTFDRRLFIEGRVSDWKQLNPAKEKATQALVTSMKAAARDLQSGLESEIGAQLFRRDNATLSRLDRIQRQAELWEDKIKILKAHSRSPTAYRNCLLYYLTSAWMMAGGKLRTSMGPDGKTPDGPLIRFLIITAKKTGCILTPHAAREFVQKNKKQLQESKWSTRPRFHPMMDSIDGVIDDERVWSAWVNRYAKPGSKL